MRSREDSHASFEDRTGSTGRESKGEDAARSHAQPGDANLNSFLPFLQDPASYPHRPERVEIVQTHASYVALVPPYVYKVKKPVNLGFLDFSTLEKRRHFCREEVRLNRRLCRDTYLGVVPLSLKNGTLVFGDGEEVVEYAVEMKHLGEGGFLDQRVHRGALRREDLDRVVETLAAFYEAETPTPATGAWGRVDKLKISTDENFAQTEADLDDLLARPAFDAIRYYTNRFYDQHALLLERRRAEGHILNGHGDLHLEHIHLTPEAVCIYDCIEFNERLRCVDVANDVAFLAMDLDFNGRPDLARYVAGRMADALDDPALLLLVDFYKCYRAYVRGKVEGMRSREPEVPAAERQASRERARRYYRLALCYAVAGSQPLVVVVMGRVGTGKSTVAQALGAALGWEVLSSDAVRKEQAGVPLYERGGETARADLYSEERTAATYAALRDGAVARARTHQGAVLDATFGSRRHRDALREACRQDRVSCCFVELEAAAATIKSRLERRETAEQVVSDARLEDFDRLCARYEAPDALEDARHFTVEAEPPPEAALLEILTHLIRLHQ